VIVLDASACVEFLLQTPAGTKIAQRIFSSGESLHAPHLLDIEISQALRRLSAARALTSTRAQQALRDLMVLRLRRYRHKPLLPRVWELRHNLTAYDGLYVALAEVLGATLLTRDGRVASAPGHRARVQLM
jgi:predicted nucleic acid-binding protein